ncbi:MAG TPA: tRNA lysidine(34) synthetase TilS [Gammaproteobacteria bacterium]|nr:tRNA lysidine(34) synthetase TilS [Gammaproteobacteria bacterium]
MTFLQRFRQSLETLYTLPPEGRYVVAFSGGVDSHVLLFACQRLGLPVRAVHVHHGLQAEADDWVVHCRAVCTELAVALTVLNVDATAGAGQSPEEAARDARYAAIADDLCAGECLLTAQHRDDQAETLLLQLFRGGSSAGMAAMPGCRPFGRGVHLRPLLDFSRHEIEAFAAESRLEWIEDPSNLDTRFDRNFLRQQVMPLLRQRWPRLAAQLANVAALQADNRQVLDNMAAIDLADSVITPPVLQLPLFHDILSVLAISRLQQLSHARRMNLLRYWIRLNLKTSPSRKLLQEIESALIHVRSDAKPQLQFNGYAFRRYRDGLYLLQPAITAQDEASLVGMSFSWRPGVQKQLSLPQAGIMLQAVTTEAGGLRPELMQEQLTLRFRQGGERFRPQGRAHSQQLKKLLQEAGIPPWERNRIPLLYCGDTLIGVAGLWAGNDAVVANGEPGWRVRMQPL